MIKFANKKEESIGLDIGEYSIKVVSMEKEAGENTLTSYNIKKLPPGTKDANLGQLIKDAFDEIDLEPESVNLSISGPDVVVRFVDLPKMSKDQLESALVFEAEKYIPFNVNEVVLDSIIMGDAPEPGHMRVLLAAAKKDKIGELIKTVEKLGVQIRVVDIDSFAMFNAFSASRGLPEDEATAFVDFGHGLTNVLVSIGDTPYFIRQVQIGGGDVTAAICRNLSVSAEKAEEYVRGIEEDKDDAVKHITISILEDIVKEMQLSFSYFENRYNREIKNVFCSGGLVYQDGVVSYLSERLGVEVKKWSPIEGLKISDALSRQDLEEVASQLAVGIGLALRD